jgi:hypothetical protein
VEILIVPISSYYTSKSWLEDFTVKGRLLKVSHMFVLYAYSSVATKEKNVKSSYFLPALAAIFYIPKENRKTASQQQQKNV